MRSAGLAFSLSTCWLLSVAPAIHAQAAPAEKPAALKWGLAPAVFPQGARMAVVSGDPSKAGLFIIELAMPSGYKIPPHFHPTEESVEVKKGTLLVGMGDTFDAAKTKAMKAGDKGSIPAKAHHFAAAQGATFIEVTSMGPFGMTYVHPADDPQKGAAKP
jgi:quercetin dioxygenase-like cupin family protein